MRGRDVANIVVYGETSDNPRLKKQGAGYFLFFIKEDMGMSAFLIHLFEETRLGHFRKSLFQERELKLIPQPKVAWKVQISATTLDTYKMLYILFSQTTFGKTVW
jgi:hypothetical protein